MIARRGYVPFRTVEYPDLQRDVRDVCARVAQLLRTAPSPEQLLVGSAWTVADVGAHLVTIARRNTAAAQGSPFEWDPRGSPHESMADANAKDISDLGERDLAQLARLLVEDDEAALRAYGTDGDRPVQWTQYEMRARDGVAIWLGELLIHGLDLARTLGREWSITSDEAAAILDGLTPALGVFADRTTARKAAGVYHVHLRGDGDFTFDVDTAGTVTADRGRPARADLHVSADPVTYLLVGYGRRSRWPAIARGAILAWGRKPWLALRFANLFEQP